MSCQTANWLNTNSLPLSCVFFLVLSLPLICFLAASYNKEDAFFLKFFPFFLFFHSISQVHIYKDQKLLKQQHAFIFIINTYLSSHSALEPNTESLLAVGCCPLTFDLSRKVVEQKSTNSSFGNCHADTHIQFTNIDRCSLMHFSVSSSFSGQTGTDMLDNQMI